jgi:hypothetical protein
VVSERLPNFRKPQQKTGKRPPSPRAARERGPERNAKASLTRGIRRAEHSREPPLFRDKNRVSNGIEIHFQFGTLLM